MNEREILATKKAEVGPALKNKWVTKTSSLSILTAGENINQDFESKSGGKTSSETKTIVDMELLTEPHMGHT